MHFEERDLGATNGVIEKSGSRFSFRGERIGQEREHARAFLIANPETYAIIDAELRKVLGLQTDGGEAEPKTAGSEQLRIATIAQTA